MVKKAEMAKEWEEGITKGTDILLEPLNMFIVLITGTIYFMDVCISKLTKLYTLTMCSLLC